MTLMALMHLGGPRQCTELVESIVALPFQIRILDMVVVALNLQP